MNTLTLEKVILDFGQLPSAPDVVMELLEYLQCGEVDIAHVGRLICLDQSLAAKTLRIANSSFYGLQSQVATIHDAMLVLGLRAVHSLATMAAVSVRIQSLQPPGYDPREFWKHSVNAALSARALAHQAGIAEIGEKAFTAGLLHDIGSLLLAARFPQDYAGIIAWRDTHDCLMLEAERSVLGFDHAQVGGALAQRWKFAPEIIDAVAWHHAPDDRPATSLAGLIHVADIMAHALEDPAPVSGNDAGNQLMPHLSELAWNRLNLSWQDFKQAMSVADAQRHDSEIMLD